MLIALTQNNSVDIFVQAVFSEIPQLQSLPEDLHFSELSLRNWNSHCKFNCKNSQKRCGGISTEIIRLHCPFNKELLIQGHLNHPLSQKNFRQKITSPKAIVPILQNSSLHRLMRMFIISRIRTNVP